MNAWLPVIGGSVMGSYNPQTQGSLVNWYDASTLGLANGANVTTWPDSKTGNPNPLSGGTAPTYATPQKNGLGTVNITVASLPTGGSSASTFPYTIATVVNSSSLAFDRTILGASTGGGLQLLVTTAGTIRLKAHGGSTIGTSTGTISTGAYYSVIATVNSSNYAFEINGVAAGSGAHAVSLTAARTFRIGQSNGGDAWVGYIGEVQIYNTVLNSGDLAGAWTYLDTKWDL